MQVNHVGIEGAVEHLPALPRIEAEPAARSHIGALFDRDRHLHTVAGAIAERKFGLRVWARKYRCRQDDDGDEAANHAAMLAVRRERVIPRRTGMTAVFTGA